VERGFKAEKRNPAKFGKQKYNGMTNADGTLGYRVKYDAKHGAHINVFDSSQKGSGGKATFTFGITVDYGDTPLNYLEYGDTPLNYLRIRVTRH
jgi:hypothetical protein